MTIILNTAIRPVDQVLINANLHVKKPDNYIKGALGELLSRPTVSALRRCNRYVLKIDSIMSSIAPRLGSVHLLCFERVDSILYLWAIRIRLLDTVS